MDRIAFLAAAANQPLAASTLLAADGSGSPGRTIVALGAIVLALAAFGVTSILARLLAAAFVAALATMSTIFSVLGRTLGLGLLGLLIVGVVLFGGGNGPSDQPTAPVSPLPATTSR